jgi:hypothetical protein
VTKVREPSPGQPASDRQQVVPVQEREMSLSAVLRLAPEPLGEKTLLRRAFVREIATEERAQRAIALDSFVQPSTSESIAARPPIPANTSLPAKK